MDVLVRMLDHHLWLVGEIIDRTGRLDDEVLDRPIVLSVEGIDADPTLRSVTDRLVGQLEMVGLSTVVTGCLRRAIPLRWSAARLDAAGPRFRDLVVTQLEQGGADETFVDAMCDPPRTFTYGGLLAHVLTFSAVRRTMAIGALGELDRRSRFGRSDARGGRCRRRCVDDPPPARVEPSSAAVRRPRRWRRGPGTSASARPARKPRQPVLRWPRRPRAPQYPRGRAGRSPATTGP